MAEFNKLSLQDEINIEASAINGLLMNTDFALDIESFETNQLALLANICKVLNPVSVSGTSSINTSLAELENKKLLKSQQVAQIHDDVKEIGQKSIDASALHENIKVLVNQMEKSKTNTEEKETSLANTTELSESTDRKVETMDIKSVCLAKMKEEYEEYLTLKSQSAKYDQRISTNIPIKQDVPLDKASLSKLLRSRKEYLSNLLQEVIQASSTTD